MACINSCYETWITQGKDVVVQEAYAIADAMMKERTK